MTPKLLIGNTAHINEKKKKENRRKLHVRTSVKLDDGEKQQKIDNLFSLVEIRTCSVLVSAIVKKLLSIFDKMIENYVMFYIFDRFLTSTLAYLHFVKWFFSPANLIVPNRVLKYRIYSVAIWLLLTSPFLRVFFRSAFLFWLLVNWAKFSYMSIDAEYCQRRVFAPSVRSICTVRMHSVWTAYKNHFRMKHRHLCGQWGKRTTNSNSTRNDVIISPYNLYRE